MRMRPINIVSDEYSDDCRHWSSQYCINYLPTVAERAGTRTEWMLRQAPGLKPLVHIYRNLGETTEESGPIRGMRNVEGKLFVVAGNTLYQITNNYVAIPYGTIPGVGRVSMTHNQSGNANELLIVNGSAGYVFNTSTLLFQKITDDGYPGAFVAWFIDGYLAQVEPQGRYWFHSDLANALSYNTLDVYEAEGQPDRIVTGHTSHREALIFGKDTIEPYVNAPEGDGTAPFQRASNTVIECGCAAKFSVETLDNSVFFLDDKRIVRRLNGYTPVRISTQAVEQALAECTQAQIAAAFSFTWEDRGHKVYYLTVPGKFTFGYDVLTQRWHRRLTKGAERWRLNDLVFWNGMWVGGDYQSGRLYKLEWGYSYDGQDTDGAPLELVRKSGSGVLHNNQNALRVHAVELICRVGGEATVPATFPAQPLSPTITGDAPDGGVGVAYTPFQYTLASGTPPYTVSLRSGSVAGLTLSPSGQWTGTPTQDGSYPLVVRVTDVNGLWNEISDSISVSLGPILVLGTNASARNLISSQSGVAWSGLINPLGLGIPNKMCGLRNLRFLAITGGSASARYSDNIGATWNPTTLAHQAHNSGWAAVVTGAAVVCGSGGMSRSTDNGANWVSVGPATTTVTIAGYDELLCALNSETRPTYSTNQGAAWSVLGSRLDTVLSPALSFQYCAGTDGKAIYFGGSTSSGLPVVAYTTDGVNFSSKELPGGVARNVTAICFAESIGDGGTWIAGCNDGTLYRWVGSPSNAVICTDSLGVECRGIVFNGLVAVAAGGASGNTVIKSSSDANIWTPRSQLLTQEIFHLAQGSA